MRSNRVGRFLARASCAGIVATVLGLGITAPAGADIINIQSNSAASTNGLGSFTGSLDYSFSMALNAWTIKITLSNTSPAGNGGAITALLFNIDSADPNADATMASSTNANFSNLTNGNGQPFGNMYDAGAGIGNSFQGSGGNHMLGINPGQSAMFTFTVAASDAASLSAEDLINGPYQYDFIVRFRGFVGGGGDKVPAGFVVPGPTVLAMMAIGVIFIPRRNRRLAQA